MKHLLTGARVGRRGQCTRAGTLASASACGLVVQVAAGLVQAIGERRERVGLIDRLARLPRRHRERRLLEHRHL